MVTAHKFLMGAVTCKVGSWLTLDRISLTTIKSRVRAEEEKNVIFQRAESSLYNGNKFPMLILHSRAFLQL